MMKWVYHHGVIDLELMTDLSKELRKRLADILVFELPEIESEKISNDGTRKWLIRVDEKAVLNLFLFQRPTAGHYVSHPR